MEKSRIYISKKNFQALSEEVKEDLRKRQVHICLAPEPEESFKPSPANSMSKLFSQIEKALKDPKPSGKERTDVLDFQ